jgi:hypothetical protein
VLSTRLGLGTEPLPDNTAGTSALGNDAQTTANAPQTAGTAPTSAPQTITPASDAPTPSKAPKPHARKAATTKATTTRKTRGAAWCSSAWTSSSARSAKIGAIPIADTVWSRGLCLNEINYLKNRMNSLVREGYQAPNAAAIPTKPAFCSSPRKKRRSNPKVSGAFFTVAVKPPVFGPRIMRRFCLREAWT